MAAPRQINRTVRSAGEPGRDDRAWQAVNGRLISTHASLSGAIIRAGVGAVIEQILNHGRVALQDGGLQRVGDVAALRKWL